MKGFLTALALCAFTTLAYAGPDQAAPMNNAPDSNTQSDMGSMRGMQGMHDAPAPMHRPDWPHLRPSSAPRHPPAPARPVAPV